MRRSHIYTLGYLLGALRWHLGPAFPPRLNNTRPANHGGRASSNVEQLYVRKTSPALLRSSHSGDAQKIQRRGRSQLIGGQEVESCKAQDEAVIGRIARIGHGLG